MTRVPFGRMKELVGHTDTTGWLTVEADRLASFAHGTYLDAGTVDLTLSRNNALGPDLVDGFLLLSLLVHYDFAEPLIDTAGVYGFNYGLNRVRFTRPVFVNDAVRIRRHVVAVADKSPTRTLVTRDIELETRSLPEQPAMVASWLILYVDGAKENEARQRQRTAHEPNAATAKPVGD